MRSARFLLFVFLVLPGALTAQIVETIEVRITNVEVVVTDSHGRPIHGLTRNDFELFEEGKRQTITNFYEVRTSAAADEKAADVIPEERRTRHIVIFVDEMTLHPLRRNTVLETLAGSLDRLVRPGDEVMVVRWNRRLHLVQHFTTDLTAVRAAIESTLTSGGGGALLFAERKLVMSNAEHLKNLAEEGAIGWFEAHRNALATAGAYADDLRQNVAAACNGLRQVLGTLGGMEGRKALVLISGEFPRRPGIDMIEAVNVMFRRADVRMAETILTEMGRDIGAEIESVIRAAAGNGVTLYAIDTGERGFSSAAAENTMPVEQTVEFLADSETAVTITEMAEATGGRALTRSRNYELLIGGLASDLESYYSLGYRSEAREGAKNIRVKMSRAGVTVRTRQLVVHKSSEEQLRDSMISNLFHERLRGDFAITLTTAEPKIESRSAMLPVTVSFQPSDLTYLREGDEMVGEFAVHFVVAAADGGLSPAVSVVKPVRLPAAAVAAISQKPFTFSATLRIGRGPQRISAAVVDHVGGAVGYGTIAVDVQP